MYILTVIPIAKGLPENEFSYFSKEDLSLGSLVEIKVRNRKMYGLVSESKNVSKEKINVKSENFSLKKIEKIIKQDFISPEIFKSIKEISILLGVKESDIVENYLPEFIFENLRVFNLANKKSEAVSQTNNKIILDNLENRIKEYEKIIKNNFENNKSVVIFFPTITDLEYTKSILEQEFEKILYFYGSQTKKSLKENLKKIEYGEIFLILSTPSLFPIMIKDKINLETIILEKENSYNYFTHTAKKQIDAREVIKKISKDLNLNLVLGGNILSLESFKEVPPDFQSSPVRSEDENLSPRIGGTIPLSKTGEIFKIIDLVKEKELAKEEIDSRTKKVSNKKENEYSDVYFSKELIEKLEIAKKENQKVFLYAKRKGLYTETVCSDCNTIFKCEKCDKPYTLFKTNTERMYICTNCKDKIILKKSENLTCKNCGSWRMNTLGVGVEGIEENLKENGWNTFILDSQNVKTKKDIKNILETWQNETSSILIGTDLALNFLNKDFTCDLAAIISLDSLFGIPEINIDEKIFNICLELRDRLNVKDKILIQTRLPEQSVWEYIQNEDILGFLENELETRKMLSLPPFSNILKFRLEKKEIKMKANIEKILEKIWEEEILNAAHPQPSTLTSSPNPFSQGEGEKPKYITTNYIYKYIKEGVQENKKNLTEFENILWQEIRDRKLGVKFSRQHVIEMFVPDFVCLEKMLIIEVDGEIHNTQIDHDKEREIYLNSLGYKVIRFTNEEIKNNLNMVLEKIKNEIEQRDIYEASPSPWERGWGEVWAENIGWDLKPNISWRLDKKTGAHIGTLIIPKDIWQKNIQENNKEKILPTNFAKKVTTLLSDFRLEINPPNVYQ